MTKELEAHIKDIWSDRENTEYGNSHIRVELIKQNISDEDIRRFEDIVKHDYEKRPLFGSLRDVFYAEKTTTDAGYDTLIFDIHKGDFVAAKRLSCTFPDAIVFVNDDWDDHAFAVYKDGKNYNDYEAAFEGGVPEPYEEDNETYYDFDFVININLPFADAVYTTYSGGGMCTKEEFEIYKNETDAHPEKEEEREI